MTVKTLSGSKFSIGPAAASTVDTLAEFAALSYVLVGEVEDMGEMGDESSVVQFAAIGDARVRKGKGARDAGTQTVVVGKDPLDAGQQAMKAAEATQFEYAIKIELADAPTPNYLNTVFYYRGLVMSQRDRFGRNDDFVRTVFNVGVNSKPIEVPAAEFTS